MGLGGISIGQLLLILVIVLLIFGGKRLGSLGSDLGGALKSFRKAMHDEEKSDNEQVKLDDSNIPSTKPSNKED